ncbi:hypothetical protein A3Q56_07663, partial [Intoshia linei]
MQKNKVPIGRIIIYQNPKKVYYNYANYPNNIQFHSRNKKQKKLNPNRNPGIFDSVQRYISEISDKYRYAKSIQISAIIYKIKPKSIRQKIWKSKNQIVPIKVHEIVNVKNRNVVDEKNKIKNHKQNKNFKENYAKSNNVYRENQSKKKYVYSENQSNIINIKSKRCFENIQTNVSQIKPDLLSLNRTSYISENSKIKSSDGSDFGDEVTSNEWSEIIKLLSNIRIKKLVDTKRQIINERLDHVKIKQNLKYQKLPHVKNYNNEVILPSLNRPNIDETTEISVSFRDDHNEIIVINSITFRQIVPTCKRNSPDAKDVYKKLIITVSEHFIINYKGKCYFNSETK